MIDGILRLIAYIGQLCLIVTVSAHHGVTAGLAMIAAIIANGVAFNGETETKKNKTI